MTPKHLVKLSNIIGISAIILLVYWVFTFITIEVFGLKVFRENMTETFYLSVLGILALMSGSLIINVMFNLTRIAEIKNREDENTKSYKRTYLILFSIFPIIGILLFGGDYLTSSKKEKMLIQSAQSILEKNEVNSMKLVNYEFNKKYINQTSNILEIYSKTDKNFPSVNLLVKDSINGSPVYLGFNQSNYEKAKDTILPNKRHYLYQTTQVEREYLDKIFSGNSDELRYSNHDGVYELFYPYKKGKKVIVLYFSERQQYGKLGS
ncbi:hypothetical protein LNP27_04245 [Flavobacterium galactosidilyticum]|uniref:hypothetical protein n=1 Tax=Flavobacterium galactosidilyticum TaxID=2893886 RepID=UPI001E5CF129|nr:hypothetical protein [Flavobacterium sp. F-340]UFH47250.1 hypothetical protein LNP27_04245 [Flavobacterium sp. F-340]